MKIKLLMIGKTVDNSLITLIEKYSKKLKHYIVFSEIVIPDLKKSGRMPIEVLKKREGELLLDKMERGDEIYLLDERGKHYSSVLFSEFLSKKMVQSTRSMSFVVGGAYGFSEEMYARATGKISLSAMTFSHQMIRLLFVEQLYRAFTIMKGEPYHNA